MLVNVLLLISAIVLLLVMSWLTLNALLYPELFRGVDKTLTRVWTKSRLNRRTANDSSSNRLDIFMHQTQPYLDPSLSLSKLAQQFGQTEREFSACINADYGVHFFDFVNQYRVNHAKNLLLSEPDTSVLDVAYQSGFNSKSSFNSAFRKHAGETPSSFRRQVTQS